MGRAFGQYDIENWLKGLRGRSRLIMTEAIAKVEAELNVEFDKELAVYREKLPELQKLQAIYRAEVEVAQRNFNAGMKKILPKLEGGVIEPYYMNETYYMNTILKSGSDQRAKLDRLKASLLPLAKAAARKPLTEAETKLISEALKK